MKVVWIVLLGLIIEPLAASQLKLDKSNKFQDMLIYIDDDIQEGDGALLKNIQDHVTAASKSLWKATGNMEKNKAAVQFGTIYIRTPKTWKVNAVPITWQQCNKADFYVTEDRSNQNAEPFTKQLGVCGEPADFTKFPLKFFETKNITELYIAGRKMMAEFVKLRYGVFSEKPFKNVLTVFNGFNFIKSTCGENITWTINNAEPMCSDKNTICKYKINDAQNHSYSVMFDAETPTSEYFCNDHDKPHNKWAQSLHNIKCERQSISSVILKHADFRENKPSQPIENINFQIVRGQSRKMVLVLDVSGSMSSIIANMKEACYAFIRDVVEESAIIALVTFSSDAKVLAYPQVMNPSNRQSLMTLINGLYASGYTNIPSGLVKAIDILGGSISSDDKLYGTIILLSDGGNNVESPYTYDYVINQVIRKGVLVNTISYGNLADPKLNKLSKESGGKFDFADPNTPYLELMNKFAAKQSCDKTVYQIKMIEDKITMNIVGSMAEANLTRLDKYIGQDIQITVTFLMDISRYTIQLINPSGKLIRASNIVRQTSGNTVTFNIPGKPEFGMYKIQTKMNTKVRYKRQSNTIIIKYQVYATPKSKERIINPTGELSSSEILLLNDQSFIKTTVDLTTCNIKTSEMINVNLTVTTPSNNVRRMVMTDDGFGDDNIEDDKIFTKILIAKEMMELGFYNFIADVKIVDNVTQEIIRRTVELGSMRVKNIIQTPIKDKVPPAKINDVKLSIINSKDRKIKIDIITTGNDGMIGNISDYEIKITCQTKEIIKKAKVNLSPGLNTAIILDLSADNITNPFQVYIRGVDNEANVGEWSIRKVSIWEYEVISKKIVKKFRNNGIKKMLRMPLLYCMWLLSVVFLLR